MLSYFLNRNNIFFLAENGYLSHVQNWVNEGGNLEIEDDKGRTPLFCAIAGGQIDTAKYLMAHYATLQSDNADFTPLMIAVLNGHREMVKCLIEEVGVDIHEKTEYNTYVCKALHIALSKAIYNGK